MGKAPILPVHITQLAQGIQHRGLDATGIALQHEDGSIAVFKQPKPAWAFVRTDEFEEFLKTYLTDKTVTALVHTRAATQGPPHRNENNHPLWKAGAAIIHNGMISNDDTLFKCKEYNRNAETDSDIIRAIVDVHGLDKKAIRQLARMRGSVASAIIDPRYPGELLLLRSDNPCILASTEDYMAFASEKNALYRALRPWVVRWGIHMQVNKPDLAFVTMPNNSAWLFKKNGFAWHQEFSTAGSYVTNWRSLPRDYRAHETFRAKKERFEKEKVEENSQRAKAKPLIHDEKGELPEYVLCPNKDCDRVLSLTPDLRRRKLSDIYCGRCFFYFDGEKYTEGEGAS